MQLSRLEPFVAIGKIDEAPTYCLTTYIELQPVTEISSMVAMRHWFNQNPDATRAFQKAIVRAASFANNNLKGTKEILIRYVPLDEEILAKLCYQIHCRFSE